MKKTYTSPKIFELGSVAELTSGGGSTSTETVQTRCYDADGNILNHTFTQPKY